MNDDNDFDYEREIVRGMCVPCLKGEIHQDCSYCSPIDRSFAEEIIAKELNNKSGIELQIAIETAKAKLNLNKKVIQTFLREKLPFVMRNNMSTIKVYPYIAKKYRLRRGEIAVTIKKAIEDYIRAWDIIGKSPVGVLGRGSALGKGGTRMYTVTFPENWLQRVINWTVNNDRTFSGLVNEALEYRLQLKKMKDNDEDLRERFHIDSNGAGY